MTIKEIFDSIANEPSTKQKKVLLGQHTDNELLKQVLYNCLSGRVNFYIKQISEYTPAIEPKISLEESVDMLKNLSNRTYTGNAGRNYLKEILESSSADNAYIIERMVDKDPKIGMNKRSVDKVIKGLIEITPYMGAQPFSEKKARKLFKDNNILFADVKADGCYNNGKVVDGIVTNESRQGEVVNLGPLSGFTQELKKFPNGVLNGELTIPGYQRTTANGIINSLCDYVINKDERTEKENTQKVAKFIKENNATMEEIIPQIIYTVWDWIDTDVYENAGEGAIVPYEERWNELKRIYKEVNPQFIKLIEKKEVSTYEEAMKYLAEKLEEKEEGIVLKTKDGVWCNKKPSYQLKLKLEFEVEMRIVGFNKGKKGTKNENWYSSLQVESEDGIMKVEPGGMKESIMKDITENCEKYLNTIVTVKANGLTLNKQGGRSLFHPRVVAFRHDKEVANTIDEIKSVELMAMGLK
jgi:hypothetical protein